MYTFGFNILTTIFFVSSVGAVHLQAHRTSLCPGDIVAVFVCEANGTSMIWRVRDNEDNVDKLEHDYGDPEGISVRRNGVSATLLRISAIDQHYLFTSMLTIFDTAGEDIRIKCSSDLSDDASREVQFYYEVPAPPPPPVIAITPSDASATLKLNWSTPTNPGQTISYAEVTLNDGHVVQVNSQCHTFSAPAVAGTVSVRTVDACGQKSEASVVEVDFPTSSLVSSWSDESYPPEEYELSKAPHTCEVCTWAVLLMLLFTIHII